LRGQYVLANLPVGAYTVRVSAKGFALAERTDVTVAVAATQTLNFPLSLASAKQSVTVSDPNLARAMVVRDIDQLWVADITYIRLQSEFVYLGVVIDAYSRRVIGWALDRTVEDDLPLAALRSALELRRPSAEKTIAALDQLPLGLVPNRR
jgi:transposase InsO family protein